MAVTNAWLVPDTKHFAVNPPLPRALQLK